MDHVVIGYGEIGRALVGLLDCDWIDLKGSNSSRETYDVVHIAIPYSESFMDAVRQYQATLNRGLTVIHSTVPIGTSDALGAIHSPCRGVHPNLLEGIKTFTKFFGGQLASLAAAPFIERGVECVAVPSARDTEAMKLWETTQYGVFILLMQEIHSFCATHGLDFDVVYKRANQSYNAGYDKLSMPFYTRPVLEYKGPGIGGHCVLPNAKFLDSFFAELVRGTPPSEDKR